MYWHQQEVFLMGILSLFPEKLTKAPITLDKEGYYFNCKTEDELVRQLHMLKKAGYIEFNEIPLLVAYSGKEPDPDDESNFRAPRGFLITAVNTNKVTEDLTKYLDNWHNDRLLTSTAHKPDDYSHQHERFLSALKRIYKTQSMPRITGLDVYGDPTSSFYDYQPPFWEVVLAPYFVDEQYEIRQMDYDLINRGQPFIDIKITDKDLKNSLEKMQPVKLTPVEWAELKLEENIAHIRLDSGRRYRLKKFRIDGAPFNFIKYVLARPDTYITRAVIQADVEDCKQKENMTELVRQCGFTKSLLPLKEAFFAGTNEKKVRFTSRVPLTIEQVDLINTNLTKSD